MMKGIRKWKAKKRLRVALSTANPPQIHCTTMSPTYGTADTRLVITVAPQKDIWPQGRTYPMNAAPIVRNNSAIPVNQTKI